MYIGIGIILAAIGAVLLWGVTGNVSGLDINTIGLVLLIAGVVAVILSLILHATGGRARTVVSHTDANGVQHSTTTDSRSTPSV